MSFIDKLKRAINVFKVADDFQEPQINYGESSYYYRPDQTHFSYGSERTIVGAIKNRMAMDAASVLIKHCRVDDDGQYSEDIDSTLNECLRVEANKDQTARAFRQDLYLSMLDEGNVCVFPSYYDDEGNILALRTGRIVQWYPDHVRVDAYDDRDGKRKEIMLSKEDCCIIENPFYSVMNEPNSTLKRLTRKLALLDVIDERVGSHRLDMIIQLPYSVRSEARKKAADERLSDIEMQLAGSKYGIAYIDSTEHITQLNRPLENQLFQEIESLTSMLYSQLSMTPGVMDGTANDAVMNNYYIRCIEPMVSAPVDEMYRKFLTKTARTRGQSIKYFIDRFQFIPTSTLPDLFGKMVTNKIMSSNECRKLIGLKESTNPAANDLSNPLLSVSDKEIEERNAANAEKTIQDQEEYS